MDTPTFMNSPQYVAFVGLLRRLHFLMAGGKGNTDEADAVRDEMDDPWYDMSTVEQERSRRLSADLYTLGQNPEAPTGHDDTAVNSLRAAIRRAWGTTDWEGILDLLRGSPGVLPPHAEAFLRGWAWNQMGDAESAALFFQRAAELDPDNPNYPLAVMEARIRAGHIDEALRYARTLLDTAARNVA